MNETQVIYVEVSYDYYNVIILISTIESTRERKRKRYISLCINMFLISADNRSEVNIPVNFMKQTHQL